MPSTNNQTERLRRTVNDLVMAEMFLVQATMESAAVIGDGVAEIGRKIGTREQGKWQTLTRLVQRTATDAVEPYTSRFKYLRS